MKRLRITASLIWLSLLVACGGGSGGGESVSTPVAVGGNSDGGDSDGGDGVTDPDVSQPIDPDTSVPDPDTSVPDDDGDAGGFATVLAGAVSGGGTTTPETNSFAGSIADIRFDSSYNLRIIVTEAGGDREVVRFSDADIQTTTDGIRLYQNENAILISSTPEGATLGQDLDYTIFGRWREFDANGLAFADGAAFFAGVPTNSASSMPTTGTGTYRGAASGQALALDRSSVVALQGTMSATADFAASNLDMSIQLVRPRTGDAWGEVNATGLTISGDRFSGDTATSSRGHTGDTGGRFFGPEAAEIGGVAELNNGLTILQVGFGAAQ